MMTSSRTHIALCLMGYQPAISSFSDTTAISSSLGPSAFSALVLGLQGVSAILQSLIPLT